LVKLKQDGIEVEVIAISQQPQRFLNNPIINGIVQKEGKEAFPVTLIDGNLFLKGRYPLYEEIL
jgi:hypothetical protein